MTLFIFLSTVYFSIALWNKVTTVDKHESVQIWFAVTAVTMKASTVPSCPWPAVLLTRQSGHQLCFPKYACSLYRKCLKADVLFTVRGNGYWWVCIMTKGLLEQKTSALRSNVKWMRWMKCFSLCYFLDLNTTAAYSCVYSLMHITSCSQSLRWQNGHIK